MLWRLYCLISSKDFLSLFWIILIGLHHTHSLYGYHCLYVYMFDLCRSPSLAIVGNACGALWNISARCPEDQKALIDLSAISMLKNLTSSKHRLISLGSAATIKNLMAFKNEGMCVVVTCCYFTE